MKILHTSDWHLGAVLHEQSRIPEQQAFLDWLRQLMESERPDALVVAGDIFDSCAPSNTALNLYYDFLSMTFKQGLCGAVVAVGGNHDSPSLLDAPGNVLGHLNTHVVGSVKYLEGDDGGRVPDFDPEVIVLPDAEGQPGLAIGAVPYLRDADLRTAEALETDADRSEKLKRGFTDHYQSVARLTREQGTRTDGRTVPLVLTGHLFLAGGQIADEQSERDLLVGNLGALDKELLPEADYYALGHLHREQTVQGSGNCRYSGAPIPMSFGECKQEKSVVMAEFADGADPVIRLVPIPQTQKLVQLKGTPESIEELLKEHRDSGEDVWIDIQVTKGEGDLSPWWGAFQAVAEDSNVKLLRWQNMRKGKTASAIAAAVHDGVDLDALTPKELFKMRLNEEAMTDDDKQTYSGMFDEILQQFNEADTNRE